MNRPLLVASVLTLAWFRGPASAQAPAPAPNPWHIAAGLGDEAFLSGDFGQHGFAFLDVKRDDVARGRLHLLYNTDTLQAGLEGIRLADGKLELSVVARGEALLAGLLFDYYRDGTRDTGRSFYASYVQLLPSLKWHPAPRHSLELVAGMRQWFFRDNATTEDTFTLPANTFVFEPRLNYTYWRIRAPSSEWEAHRIHPRIEGVAIGVSVGLDRRTQSRPWGADVGGQLDPRNDPGAVVLTTRQWLYAGARLGGLVRLQFEEHASYGVGEDDLTRNRVGGMNPYVVPIAGLPWAAVLSERLVSGRATLHVRTGRQAPHEVGVGVDGAVFSDPHRTGAIGSYGGAGGAYLFGDFRTGRFQLHGRVAYGFPAPSLDQPPNLSALVFAGVRIR